MTTKRPRRKRRRFKYTVAFQFSAGDWCYMSSANTLSDIGRNIARHIKSFGLIDVKNIQVLRNTPGAGLPPIKP